MVGIDVMLRHAREVKAAMEAIGTKPREKIVKTLRKASITARGATSPVASDARNAARTQAANDLTILIPALEAHLETPGRKTKAKDAIEAWIKELEAAKP